MTEDERHEAQPPPRRVRVTDRRRVHQPGRPGPADAAPSEPVTDGALRTDAPVEHPVEPSASEPGEDRSAEAELESVRAELAEHREQLQRLSADFDNARKRMSKDHAQAVERAAERLVTQLLEVLDEFQLAMLHGEQSPEFAPYLKGFELVYAKLFETLRAEGLERIAAEGQPFDPTRQEALIQTGDGEGEPVVSEILREGYTFKGKVLRPAGVKVHRGEA
jgi:molecular chaperone GrpE